jgi:signal transduction histidine kinase
MDLEDLRITSIAPGAPVNQQSIVERLRLTAVAAGSALLGIPAALVLLVLSLVGWPLVLIGIGILIVNLTVPGTAHLTRAHRVISGALLGEEISARYVDDSSTNVMSRPLLWLRDPARRGEVGFLAFSATGGFVLSAVPALLLASPTVYLVMAVVDRHQMWLVLFFFVGGPNLALWWLTTPALVKARAVADRALLGLSRTLQLERRVAEVASSRAENVDHSAAEIRRIERDLHDGAQARIVSVGMQVGLAEELMKRDPEAAAVLLREARESTVFALDDLRSVIRGILPPVLADRGLVGAVEALAVELPIPIMITLALRGTPPAPVESAMYFAVAECLANTIKHARASRAWVSVGHQDGVLRVECGDNGRGGADATSPGLSGVARRLAAFDGTMTVDSPEGGPTTVIMEVPCQLTPASSSPRTSPSSATD